MIVYKLFRLGRDGLIYPLFINRNTPTPMNVWIDAECFPTKGFAVRKGWHCCFEMNAPHLKKNLASGERRVWAKCEVTDYDTYDRPESQGGKWVLADRLRIIEVIG